MVASPSTHRKMMRSRRHRRSRSASLPIHYRRSRNQRSSRNEKNSKRSRSHSTGRSRSPPHSTRHLQQRHRDDDTKHRKSHRRLDDRHKSRSDERHSPNYRHRQVKSTAFRVKNQVETYSNGCDRIKISGIDVEQSPSRCIAIFGMNRDTTKGHLFALFKKFGSIEYMSVIRDHETGLSRGFAFIYYNSIKCAYRARKRLGDTLIDGHRVRIEFVRERYGRAH